MEAATPTPLVPLGRTGLKVSRIGVAAGYGVGREGLELAREAGVNLFYWGSLRRDEFGRTLGEFARADRASIVVAIQSYSRMAFALKLSVESALRRLGLDHADILILGYWPSVPWRGVLDAARALRERGLVRHLCVSCHNQDAFSDLLQVEGLDVLMARYNAAHRGAEEKLFPLLSDADRPGLFTFTSTYWGRLIDPKYAPPGERAPTAADCYRFALSHPAVDATLCGPSNLDQMREALTALRLGPMSGEELAWMRRAGERLAREHPSLFYEKA